MLGFIVLASLFISIISFVGGLILIQKRFQSATWLSYMVSFAAGVMLTAAFLDLLPEASHEMEHLGEHGDIFLPAFLGVLTFFFLERYVLWFHHHDDTHGAKPSAVLILLGDALHNFVDGIAIAAAFLTNPGVGIAATLAIAAHEIPQEIADFSVLLHGGMSKSKALFYNFLSAITALFGAIVGYFFLENLEGTIPVFLAFTAGMFIYIACSDLIPEIHKDFKKSKGWFLSVPFILGVLVLFTMINLLSGIHSH